MDNTQNPTKTALYININFCNHNSHISVVGLGISTTSTMTSKYPISNYHQLATTIKNCACLLPCRRTDKSPNCDNKNSRSLPVTRVSLNMHLSLFLGWFNSQGKP